jgi:hypothetical protein
MKIINFRKNCNIISNFLNNLNHAHIFGDKFIETGYKLLKNLTM